MMAGENENEGGYSWLVGTVYLFNLIVATGLVTLPKAFAEVGLILGLIVIILLGLIGYCTVTFLIEVQSIYNAIQLHTPTKNEEYKEGKGITEESGIHNDIEITTAVSYHNDGVEIENSAENGQPTAQNEKTAVEKKQCGVTRVINNDNGNASQTFSRREVIQEVEVEVNPGEYLYDITVETDLGELCKPFFSKVGITLSYGAICLYLYGSISIHLTAIAKSATSIVCNDTNCFVGNDSAPCKTIRNLSVLHTYRVMVTVCLIICSPFIFLSLTKSKILQLCTTLLRWFALISMIVLALLRIGKGEGNDTPNLLVFSKVSNFIGIALYVFLVQISIPNVITPVTNKTRLNLSMILTFSCVTLVTAFILITSIYAFDPNEIQDLYTFNFNHPVFFKYLFQLFPIYSSAACIPILGVTLRENLKTLFLPRSRRESWVLKITFPLLVIIPPSVITYNTYNVGMLAGYTGAYAGGIVQYVIPAMLVYCGRKQAIRLFGEYKNKHRSPFYHRNWIYFVLVWYLICFVSVTYYKVTV